ncbi:hypothetical protein ACJRO7_013432 [Eucalyptus globulus]|uniref:Cytosol aminopeptidase domain-containing protein n=1 Tax=Eucalyptus globulus TaxID=34317 RepID=A0ABD3L2S5_EUCGL
MECMLADVYLSLAISLSLCVESRVLGFRAAASSSASSFWLSFALMARALARPTLGLTQPADVDVPKSGDIIAVGVTERDIAEDENSIFQNSILERLDAQLSGLLAEAFSEEDFTGKSGQSVVLRLPAIGSKRVAGIGSKRVSLIGLSQSASTPTAFRGLGEAVAAAAKAAQASNVGIVLASSEGLSAESKLTTASAMHLVKILIRTVLGINDDTRYKSESRKLTLKSVDILGLESGPELDKKLKYAEDVSSGIIFGGELVNSPANVLTPSVLAHEASKIASTYSDVLSATILDVEQCKELKMGSYLGVAAASANPPHFIHLCYKPVGGTAKVKLALWWLQYQDRTCCIIELMKFDMGGSAAVLGAAKLIGQIKPPGVEVHFIVAACENMISGTGMRQGDIVTASNGKTIEVSNTDAEGRLTLADALVYACNQGMEKIVDLATFTSACTVALGPSIAGVFTPSDDLAKGVFAASELSGEKLWRMPLEESYWGSMKSGVADMVNTAGRQGDAIRAALFLKQFVDEKVQWLHIDMGAPVWNGKKKAATGFGISTIVEWVLRNAS